MGRGKNRLIGELLHPHLDRTAEPPAFDILGSRGSNSTQPLRIAACLYDQLKLKCRFDEPKEWGEHNLKDADERLEDLLLNRNRTGCCWGAFLLSDLRRSCFTEIGAPCHLHSPRLKRGDEGNEKKHTW